MIGFVLSCENKKAPAVPFEQQRANSLAVPPLVYCILANTAFWSPQTPRDITVATEPTYTPKTASTDQLPNVFTAAPAKPCTDRLLSAAGKQPLLLSFTALENMLSHPPRFVKHGFVKSFGQKG